MSKPKLRLVSAQPDKESAEFPDVKVWTTKTYLPDEDGPFYTIGLYQRPPRKYARGQRVTMTVEQARQLMKSLQKRLAEIGT